MFATSSLPVRHVPVILCCSSLQRTEIRLANEFATCSLWLRLANSTEPATFAFGWISDSSDKEGYWTCPIKKNINGIMAAARTNAQIAQALTALTTLVVRDNDPGRDNMYTIEFQKRGLPHAHILIFLHPSSKYHSPEDIDTIISAEIPNPDSDPELYNLVKKHMIHGPCGSSRLQSPCTVNGRCTKFFPKKFNEKTIVDQDGYPVYRRSSNSYTVEKNGVTLDNGYVVPYNKRLLLKYQGHINMEWCNQSSSIKYLFKYIHKGYDRITATVERAQNNGGNQQIQIDEIKQYVDCRYISPCEACWRIFSFKIHGRKPAVERMFFHLVGENTIYFTDFDRMENILENPSVTESMFTSWLQANKDYPAARKLTYGQFVTKFTYSKKKKSWTPRKRGFKIGRLIWVPPTTGELFYLRMMLTVVKGPMSYEDIKKVRNIQYDTFRDACFAKGFLGDDKEYISAIREAHGWGPDSTSEEFSSSSFFVRFLASSPWLVDPCSRCAWSSPLEC
ncbi:unnamed protein product [Trifolium pratense]|uniref:Uncharacterized protein n=1 Tax=Trifolium pratense TaxID=57577 RepID=A0ACB0MBD3_TRIPR|nr:unnamed protein product [Trifolium pratense]